MSLKDQIVKAVDLPTKAVEVPEWGCTVYLRTLKLSERNSLAAIEGKDVNAKMVRILAKVLCDENGNAIFSESAEDLALLGAKAAPVLDRLISEALHWNKMLNEDVRDLEKN